MSNWADWLLAHEVSVRLAFFFSVFFMIACWEMVAPRRLRRYSRLFRWSNNLALVALNSFLLRLLFPVAAVGVALWAESNGYGLFNLLALPLWINVVLSVVLLDMLIYFQHVLFHRVPILWALHKVHHVDPDYDVTTGARFHPVEIILSMFIKMLAITLLGPAAIAVIIFEVLLNGSAMFNHGNIRLPSSIDKVVRLFFVTPDMHRVHHSQIRQETDSNYGFSLSCWDRLFSTYIERPSKGQEEMDIGVEGYENPDVICRLGGMLRLPFKR